MDEGGERKRGGGGREVEALSERASFACGIKIRVPRYIRGSLVFSDTTVCGSFHVRTREARLSASRNPFFVPPRTSRTAYIVRPRVNDDAHRRIFRETADLWEDRP